MSSIINGKKVKRVAGLNSVSSELYENIFNVNLVKNKDKNFRFYNTLNKVIFPDNLSSEVYDELIVQVDTPWTTLSYNIYGTINLWWVVYLINKPKYIFLAKSGSKIRFILPSAISTVLNSMQ